MCVLAIKSFVVSNQKALTSMDSYEGRHHIFTSLKGS